MTRDVFTYCSRFVGVVGFSWLAVLDRRIHSLQLYSREKSREQQEVVARSAEPDQLDRQTRNNDANMEKMLRLTTLSRVRFSRIYFDNLELILRSISSGKVNCRD